MDNGFPFGYPSDTHVEKAADDRPKNKQPGEKKLEICGHDPYRNNLTPESY